jgi:hypothetical protein
VDAFLIVNVDLAVEDLAVTDLAVAVEDLAVDFDSFVFLFFSK